MKIILKKTLWAALGPLLIGGVLAVPALAQDDTDEGDADRVARREAHREEMEQRRSEYLEEHPEEAARIEERRQQREKFLEENPDIAARVEERRQRMRERAQNGEEFPRRQRPGFEGRPDGPPPGAGRRPGPGFEGGQRQGRRPPPGFRPEGAPPPPPENEDQGE